MLIKPNHVSWCNDLTNLTVTLSAGKNAENLKICQVALKLSIVELSFPSSNS